MMKRSCDETDSSNNSDKDLLPELWGRVLCLVGPWIQTQPICKQWQVWGFHCCTRYWMKQAILRDKKRLYDMTEMRSVAEWLKQPADWHHCWTLWRCVQQADKVSGVEEQYRTAVRKNLMMPGGHGFDTYDHTTIRHCFLLCYQEERQRYALFDFDEFRHLLTRVVDGTFDHNITAFTSLSDLMIANHTLTPLVNDATHIRLKHAHPLVWGAWTDVPLDISAQDLRNGAIAQLLVDHDRDKLWAWLDSSRERRRIVLGINDKRGALPYHVSWPSRISDHAVISETT